MNNRTSEIIDLKIIHFIDRNLLKEIDKLATNNDLRRLVLRILKKCKKRSNHN